MYQWSVVDDPGDADLAVLSEGVVRYGRSLALRGEATPIACFVRDAQGIVAGGSGRTEFSRLFVGYLWVAENMRSRGLGSKILSELEAAAHKRGCVDAVIETLNDDAARCMYVAATVWSQRSRGTLARSRSARWSNQSCVR